ncbi:hypothetical protein Q9966_009041 [Columba livia]|nr:hypothetical protein Q9966_009041 [Columba livia]
MGNISDVTTVRVDSICQITWFGSDLHIIVFKTHLSGIGFKGFLNRISAEISELGKCALNKCILSSGSHLDNSSINMLSAGMGQLQAGEEKTEKLLQHQDGHIAHTGAASGETYFTVWHRVVLVPCHNEALPPSQHLGTAQSVRKWEERKDVIEDHSVLNGASLTRTSNILDHGLHILMDPHPPLLTLHVWSSMLPSPGAFKAKTFHLRVSQSWKTRPRRLQQNGEQQHPARIVKHQLAEDIGEDLQKP